MIKKQSFLADICERKIKNNNQTKKKKQFYSSKYISIKPEVDKVLSLRVGKTYNIIIEEVEGVNYE